VSDNNNEIAREVVEKSKTITIVIELKQDGSLQLSGPLNDPVAMLGILELAKNMVHNPPSKKRTGNILVPMLKGPGRPS